MITRTDIFNFIWSQPIYFSIPLLILFFMFCILMVIGTYSIFVGIVKSAEEFSEFSGLSEKISVILTILGYIAVYFALAYTNLLE